MVNPVLVIPAYQPNQQLLELIKEFRIHRPHQSIVVIDDGSDSHLHPIFEALTEYNVKVLRHAVNLGKGQALQTAFNDYINCCEEDFSLAVGVVTADADGQHSVADIIAISDALTHNPYYLHLGVRNFKNRQVPWRSKVGNCLVGFCFRQLYPSSLQDTQTGLRGIPTSLISQLLNSKSKGYEFELEMLLLASNQKITIQETPIQTIYLSGNATSHFDPFLDSMRVYFVFIRFSAISLFSAVLDFSVFMLVYGAFQHIFPALLIGRLLSATFNFKLNQRLTFKTQNFKAPHSKSPSSKSRKNLHTSALKYACLAILLGLLSYTLVSAIADYHVNIVGSKILAELILFITSFSIQRYFVFNRPKALINE